MSEIALFSNDEFRLEITADGNTFRVRAPGIAKALGFHSARDLLRTIPDDEKGVETAPTPGGEQATSYLTEGGFYRAIGQRQAARVKSEAVRDKVSRFQRWVYNDVLPAVRRGELVSATPAIPDMSTPEGQLAVLDMVRAQVEARMLADRRALEAAAGRELAEQRVAELEPSAYLWETLVQADGDYLVGDAAKILHNDRGVDTGPQRLFEQMRDLGWVFRSGGDRGRWRVKQTAIETGRLREKLVTREDPNTGERVAASPQVRVTVKGIKDLHQALAKRGGQLAILPGGAA